MSKQEVRPRPKITSKPKLKILLVEDHRLIQLATKMHFEAAGGEVDVASNGTEAIKLADAKRYNLILMDIGLGDYDGYTVTEIIRANSTKNAQTPIIALTAHTYDERQAVNYKVKMDDYIVKPITSDLAKNILQKYSHIYDEI